MGPIEFPALAQGKRVPCNRASGDQGVKQVQRALHQLRRAHVKAVQQDVAGRSQYYHRNDGQDNDGILLLVLMIGAAAQAIFVV